MEHRTARQPHIAAQKPVLLRRAILRPKAHPDPPPKAASTPAALSGQTGCAWRLKLSPQGARTTRQAQVRAASRLASAIEPRLNSPAAQRKNFWRICRRLWHGRNNDHAPSSHQLPGRSRRDPRSTRPDQRSRTDGRMVDRLARGRYTGRALAMASPASTAQLADLVKLCAAHRVPIVAAGRQQRDGGRGPRPITAVARCCCRLRRMDRIRALPTGMRGQVVCEGRGVILQHLH